MPTETQEVDEAERKKLGLGKYGQLFSKAELMEVSVVAVPANPAALELGMKSLLSEGLIEKNFAGRFLNTYPGSEEAAHNKAKAICRSFVDFGAVHKSTQNVLQKESPVESSDLKSDQSEIEEKSPACRQDGETKNDCVERKIPELIDEGMDNDQAVAVANSVCENKCSPYEEEKTATETSLVQAVAWLVEQQAEQTKATRQLVDSLTDLTKAIHRDLPDGVQSDGSVSEPEVATPDVEEKEVIDVEGLLEGRLRGFAEGLRRDLNLSNNTENNR